MSTAGGPSRPSTTRRARIASARAKARAGPGRPASTRASMSSTSTPPSSVRIRRRRRRPRTTSTVSASPRSWPSSTPPANPWPPACDRATPAPGNAEDHVIVLDAALAQLPIDPTTCEVIARTDAGGLFTPLHRGLRGAQRPLRRRPQTQCRVGGRGDPDAQEALAKSHLGRWHRRARSGEVAEITDLVDLSRWSEGTRMIARRELPHPGAQLTFSDIDGYRYQVFITDHQDADVCFLEGLYRGRGRCERRICDTKDTGLANLPSASFAINEAWLSGPYRRRSLGLDEGTLPRERTGPGRAQATALHASCTQPACWCTRRDAPPCASPRVGPGPTTSWRPSPDCRTGPAPELIRIPVTDDAHTDGRTRPLAG